MRYTEELMSEHRSILRMIDALESMSAMLEAGQPVPVSDMKGAIDFIRQFADKCHHAKEEGLLFPALEAAGMPKEGGPIGQMLVEHVHGREFVAGMAAAADRYPDDASAGPGFAENARGYAELLRAHIRKEDDVLYPMADQFLAADVREDLAVKFDAAEREVMGPERHAEYLGLVDRMVATYPAAG